MHVYACLVTASSKCVTYSVICIVMIAIQPNFIKSCQLSFDPSVLVPTTPVLDVCAVYDVMNETLQIIESNWTEVVCKNGHLC